MSLEQLFCCVETLPSVLPLSLTSSLDSKQQQPPQQLSPSHSLLALSAGSQRGNQSTPLGGKRERERERKQKADKYRSRTAANLLVRSWQLARVAISAIRLWWRQGRCTMAQREAKQCAKWTATQTAPFTLVCLKMQQTYLWSLVSNCTGHPYCQLTGKGEGCFCFLSVLLLLIIIIIWEAKIAQATTDRRRNCKFRWNWQCRKLSVNSSNSSSNSSSYQACDCNESNE